jgi:hypothetical protein
MFLMLIPGIAISQDLYKRMRIELVGGAGISQFFGDIGGYSQTENILGIKDIILRQTRFTLEGAVKYRVIPEVNIKFGLNAGMFHAIDTKGSNEGRGLEATTSFLEPALTAEYCFIKSKKEGLYTFTKGKNLRGKFFSFVDMYAFTGFGGLAFHVKGNDALKASGMTTGGFTAVIPAGLGANYLASPNYSIGFEIGGRYSFSDYLDGISPQYSKSNDVYYFLTFTITYKIPTKPNGVPVFLSKSRY